jgi:hypothetical protein
MKKIILVLSLAVMLMGCGAPENKRLRGKVDSLQTIIIQNREASIELDEVGVLLDSIDASSKALDMNVVEGITYADYISRLKSIHMYIKNSQEKIAALEANQSRAKGISASTIKRLKANLELKSRETVDLQLLVVKLQDENRNQFLALMKNDTTLSNNAEVIRLKSKDIATLQDLVQDINEQNKRKVADLYFGQAQALETAANRTKFAPRKKKETRREALELYRLSSSMGNLKAGDRIAVLEKELS